MKSGYVIGIDAGGTKVAYGLFNPAGERIDRAQHRRMSAPRENRFPTRWWKIFRRSRAKQHEDSDLDGIGICMPSFILFDEGYVLMTSACRASSSFRCGTILKRG
jgi:glucokinase